MGRRDLGPPQNCLAVTMKGRIFALVDCNNFYVSCQRAFNVSLHNKPTIALSNNDGCVIARSTGGHDVWQRGECQAPVPRHGEIAAGTIRAHPAEPHSGNHGGPFDGRQTYE